MGGNVDGAGLRGGPVLVTAVVGKRRKRRWMGGRGLPAEEVTPPQSHEVDLTGASGADRGEEHLVVPLAQELESLRSLVHEDSI